MKKSIILLVLLANTLFGADKIFNDYTEYGKTNYMGGDMKFTSFYHPSGDSDHSGKYIPVMLIGASAGVFYDNRFYTGGAVYTSIDNYFANGDIVNSNISLTYAGGVFGILLNGDDSYHTIFQILGGLGFANDANYTDSMDLVLMLEPEIALELNLTNFARLKISASWRVTQGVDTNHLGGGLFGSDNTLLGAGYGSIFNFGLGVILGQY